MTKHNFISRCTLLLKSWKALFVYAFGDEEKAVRQFEECIRLDPENGLNLRTLGKILIGKGRYVEGLEKVKEALKHLKSNDKLVPEVHAYIGYCYSELDRLDESIHFYKKAIDSWVRDGEFKKRDLYYGLGRLYLRQKKYEEAIDTFKNGLEFEKKPALMHFRLGIAYYEVGDQASSLQHLVTALKLDQSLRNDETMKRLKKELECSIPVH